MPLPDEWLTNGVPDPAKMPLPEQVVLTHPVAGDSRTKDDLYSPPAPFVPVEQRGGYLWMRKWQLTVSDQPGTTALDLSLLAFQFEVTKQMNLSLPGVGIITIYNATDDVITRMSKDLTYVRLDAGYKGTQYGPVFVGYIAYYKRGRKDATDTFVEIHAIEHVQEVTNAVLNTTLPAGHTQGDVLKACIASFDQSGGITLGKVPDGMDDTKSPRGRALFGNTVDVIRDVADSNNATAFIDSDNKLNILRRDESLDMAADTVPLLNPLIDVPTATLGAGVEGKTLLNPALKVGGRLKINIKDITDFTAVNVNDVVQTAMQFNLKDASMAIATDGVYSLAFVRHFGENRGNSWYTEFKTQPIDASKIAPRIVQSV